MPAKSDFFFIYNVLAWSFFHEVYSSETSEYLATCTSFVCIK